MIYQLITFFRIYHLMCHIIDFFNVVCSVFLCVFSFHSSVYEVRPVHSYVGCEEIFPVWSACILSCRLKFLNSVCWVLIASSRRRIPSLVTRWKWISLRTSVQAASLQKHALSVPQPYMPNLPLQTLNHENPDAVLHVTK